MAYLYPLAAIAVAGAALPNVFSAVRSQQYPVKYVGVGDGEEQLVRDLPDKDRAAMVLKEIKRRCFVLRDVVQRVAPSDPRARRLQANLNERTIFNEATPDSSQTSQTKNKGENIVFCLRQRNASEELVDINTMMFVAIHELGHVVCDENGHTKKFWDCFAWLLRIAIDNGIQEEQSFKTNPVEQCGTKITGSPL